MQREAESRTALVRVSPTAQQVGQPRQASPAGTSSSSETGPMIPTSANAATAATSPTTPRTTCMRTERLANIVSGGSRLMRTFPYSTRPRRCGGDSQPPSLWMGNLKSGG